MANPEVTVGIEIFCATEGRNTTIFVNPIDIIWGNSVDLDSPCLGCVHWQDETLPDVVELYERGMLQPNILILGEDQIRRKPEVGVATVENRNLPNSAGLIIGRCSVLF